MQALGSESSGAVGLLRQHTPPATIPTHQAGLLRRFVQSRWSLPVLPVLVMLMLGAWRLGTPQIWRDEAASWSAASRPLRDLGRLSANIDAVITPYYAFLHFWIKIFGTSAAALRLPSVLAMVGAAGLVVLIGKRLFGPHAAVLAGLVFALIPAVSRYAQEARPYALATFAATLATYLLIHALTRPTWPRWAGYAGAIALLGLSHMVALIVLGGHALAVGWWLWRTRDFRALRWLLACLVGFLPLAVIIRPALQQRSAQIGTLTAPTWEKLLTLPAELFQSGAVAGVVVGLALLAPWLISRRAADPTDPTGAGEAASVDGTDATPIEESLRRLGIILLVAAGPGSAALLWSISQVKSFWYTRYLLFTTPAFALLAAAALVGIRVGRRQIAMITAAVLVVAVLGADDQRQLRHTLNHDWYNYPMPLSSSLVPIPAYREAAGIIKANQLNGDALVYANNRRWQALVMDYELRDGPAPKDVLLASSATRAGSLFGRDCANPLRCFGTPQRVWVVEAGPRTGDPLAVMPPARAELLRDGYRQAKQWRVSGMALTLYTRVP